MNQLFSQAHPAVTVAIPFYNAEAFLGDAIRSVLNQSFRDFELLLIDDGSTDKSLEIARSFPDTRITVISDNSNKGLCARLNQSVEMARGEYYARMDADDIMHPDRLKIQLEYLKDNEKYDVLGTSYFSINQSNEVIAAFKMPPRMTVQDFRILHPSVIARTEWFRKNRYDARFKRIEDFELWLRTTNRYTIGSLPLQLMFYREFGVPTFSKYFQTQLNAFKIYSHYKRYGLTPASAAKEMCKRIVRMGACLYAGMRGDMNILVKMRKAKPTGFDTTEAAALLAKAIKA